MILSEIKLILKSASGILIMGMVLLIVILLTLSQCKKKPDVPVVSVITTPTLESTILPTVQKKADEVIIAVVKTDNETDDSVAKAKEKIANAPKKAKPPAVKEDGTVSREAEQIRFEEIKNEQISSLYILEEKLWPSDSASSSGESPSTDLLSGTPEPYTSPDHDFSDSSGSLLA